ncbi:Protein N-acetyltransferase, RimJ/RimL family [Pseudoxanthomonas sp. CF385]|uniref:GNAT family N-acetyltransferase n=1 Tax=Pseudoxanthomonas sp. CF385 TaxID=1881042 RepID=UPI00088BCB1E|nr:GNAT family N-acetyltransferase [Pseudoxanthomonas sp. CF385]SDQ54808.1 Protein N-acetyltransferase, RimJ/RimL family [Pseudoxanthomonas sp. CF385]
MTGVPLVPGTLVAETPRLRLRAMADDRAEDAALMLTLLNEPSFIRNIADRGVRTLEQASAYLRQGAMRSYAEHGLGMYVIERKDTGELIGNCGLVRREGLDGPDIGYALLPAHVGYGLAEEAARAVMADARDRLRLCRLLAIVNPDNAASIRLLQKLGFVFERMVTLPHVEQEVGLYHANLLTETSL